MNPDTDLPQFKMDHLIIKHNNIKLPSDNKE